MKSLLAAIQFLTTIPVPTYLDKKYFLSSSKWYLCVGLLLGITLAFMDDFFRQIAPGSVASTLTVFFLVILTGGLHLDGLADTADGFLSYQNRDKTLEIMKDSRSGVMAILSVFFVLSLKIILLSHINHEFIFGLLILLPFLGRFSILFQMSYLPYAREKGLGQIIEVNTLTFWISLVLVFGISTFICNFAGIIYVLIIIFLNISFSVYCFFKIKGYTGDTVGAAVELTEVFFLLMVVVEV